FGLVVVLLLLSMEGVNGQSCSVPVIGPCLGTTCPAGNTCLTTMATPSCCPDANVVPDTTTTAAPTTTAPATTTAAGTTAPSANCVDLLNPSTGVSD
ncbi:hypothetical protein PFISCL1PPCAC_27026, partial [Pristionchus fissidentatus]